MKVLITGKGGQLAWELEQTKPKGVELLSLGIETLDITNQTAVVSAVNEFKPDVVINAAAYTAVDKAEADTNTAYAVNEAGARYLAEACKQASAFLLHVSTDFVFDGSSCVPYQTDAAPNPINVYGASKLAGDIAVQQILPETSVIVRTAWVYSANGNNFVKTMLRLMAEKPELGVIYDQLGSPTWARGLAQWLWNIARKTATSSEFSDLESHIFHWTDAGVASWYDFAIAIQELGIEKGMLKQSIPVRPIPTSAYPTPAKRPAFSVIDKSSAEKAADLHTVHWRKQLSAMMDELKDNLA
ncbi:dTDP-4-dehydrorhamnose reductase [Echinimonas agarilytica]|uniref:dTDP-4-dehydrorhamnose reductase n=1 Tax=Echinimonas agarilytica TaxID=1215918 RepID=A0AA41W7Q5_9GAMM|nr:dTDP-4-dehydrorhamnose reductase [Echinimonas agarilytica]MCM2680113.1 dTDP-4-dehydrorhamnose reductase [Echinimonas agarilytica]